MSFIVVNDILEDMATETQAYVEENGQLPEPISEGMPWTNLPGELPTFATTQTAGSAKAMLDAYLRDFGLEGVGERLWELYKGGMPIEQVMLEVRKQPEWLAKYGVITEAAKKGIDLDEAQVRAIRNQYKVIGAQYQLPADFYDQDGDFDQLILAGRSPAEFASELESTVGVIQRAPKDVLDELQNVYGMTMGDLIAFWREPDKAQPLIERQIFVRGAGLSAIGKRTGFGGLNATEASGLARLGVSDDQAMQGFGELAGSQELFRPLDLGEDEIGRQEQLGAVFEGNSTSRRRIEQRARRRTAVFEGGGQFATGQQGFAGLGST